MEKLKSLHLSERPYPNPVSRLSEALKLLRMSDTEWTKKMIALETLQMLIVHHPHMVAEKRPIISVALINEGNSKRLRLACAALDTIALMFLRMFMDADVEIATKSMLLLLAKDSIMSLKERVHLALYCLARSCSCSRFIIALLKCGQGHSSNCLRAGTIEQIGHLVDLNGADKIFASMRHSNKQLVIALSKMALDRAPEVRHEAQRILKAFIHIPEFRKILTDVVPFKNKKQMDTILKGLM
ncbi:TOG array regulator of axonemal microtubules protein 1-like [Eucyclogobius newberryi]|uniref:TOG array regulator of axonemal microtubules protein 1-like n=1 Tax=Eucyclogobius newberryi TaxID=166745 RepID=UPI003B5CF875